MEMTERDVVLWLQAYKGYLQQALGFPVNLFWRKEICWEKRTGSAGFEDVLVDRSVHGLPILSAQVRGGVLAKVVEEWLSLLPERQGAILFHRYINHDFEKPRSWFEENRECETGKMKYKTIPYRVIGDRLGISKSLAEIERSKAIRIILGHVNRD